MVTKNLEEEKEKKNKRRGFVIAFFIHVGIVILALIPFLTSESEEEVHEIMIQFANYEPPPPEVEPIPFDDSGSSEPDNPKGDTQEAMEQEAAPEQPDVPEPEAAPEVPDDPAPEPTPVETTPEPSPVSAPEVTEPKPTPPKPTPPKPTKPTVPDDKPTKPTRPKPVKPSTGSDANTSNNNGNQPGKPGTSTGSGDAPSAGNNGSGGTDDGTGSGEGSGHGFSRKVKDRPNQSEIKAIAQNKTGKVHVDVCINQMGKVVSAKSNKSKSTIKDNLVLQKAQALAKKYRFEKDFKAPVKQCWYLVFNFSDNKGSRLVPQAYDQIIFID